MALELAIKYSFGGQEFNTEEEAFSAAWGSTYGVAWEYSIPGVAGGRVPCVALSESNFYAADKNGNRVVPYSVGQLSKIEYLYIKNEDVAQSWAYMLELLGSEPTKWGNGITAGAWRKAGNISKWAPYASAQEQFLNWNLSKINSWFASDCRVQLKQ